MRKLLVLAILTTTTLAGLEVHAAVRRTRPQVSAGQAQGPVNRLMELERRKNAALRQAFLGR